MSNDNHTNFSLAGGAGVGTSFGTDARSDAAYAGTNRLITGVFRDSTAAEAAFQVAVARGYARDEIHLITSEATRNRYLPNSVLNNVDNRELPSEVAEGVGVGGAIGGALGAIAGALAAVGTSLVIPGLGIVVAGPIVAALAGAGTGGAAGGLIGAMVGFGVPEDHAKVYEDAVKEGHIVISVNARSEEDARFLEKKWKELDGEHIYW
jgi:hypothetical protein